MRKVKWASIVALATGTTFIYGACGIITLLIGGIAGLALVGGPGNTTTTGT